MTIPTSSPFLVSAPGKVILFGEHASVYGKPAIAAALSLRTYLLVTPSPNPNEIVLDFPDVGLYKKWNRNELPWEEFNKIQDKLKAKYESDSSIASLNDELVPELVLMITKMLITIENPQHFSSAYAFMYLYMNLCSENLPGHIFTTRSTLPIGAGLGSSASLSVCLSGALSLMGGHIQKGILGATDLSEGECKDAEFIDSWAFIAEKCIHGNPSGIDNTVSCHGGAVMFQRMKSSVPSVRTIMRNFPSFRLLLTNTKQPRRTAVLVSKVSVLVNSFPKTSNSVLEAIENITKEGYKLMVRPFFDEEARTRLRELIRMNHGLLVSLGVSHPTLEKVKVCCDEMDVGDTKLTGAGGGGCAITLLKDELSKETVMKLEQKLTNLGFETFETTLGGKGVAVLSDSPDLSIFDATKLHSLKSRNEIEDWVGMGIEGWKYW